MDTAVADTEDRSGAGGGEMEESTTKLTIIDDFATSDPSQDIGKGAEGKTGGMSPRTRSKRKLVQKEEQDEKTSTELMPKSKSTKEEDKDGTANKEDETLTEDVVNEVILLRDEKLLRAALKKGAVDVQEKLDNGDYWIHRAAMVKSSKAVDILLKHGAEVESEDSEGNTAFMRAATDGNVDVMKLLLRKGADVDYQNTFGNTALHLTVLHGREEALTFLLGKNADLQLRNSNGETPLLVSTCKFRADPDVPGLLAYYPPSVRCIRALLDAGSDPNIRDYQGNTPLTKLLEEPREKQHVITSGFSCGILEACAAILSSTGTATTAHMDIPGDKSQRFIDIMESPRYPYQADISQYVTAHHRPERLECLSAQSLASMLLRSFGTAATMYVKANIVDTLRTHMPIKCYHKIQSEEEDSTTTATTAH